MGAISLQKSNNALQSSRMTLVPLAFTCRSREEEGDTSHREIAARLDSPTNSSR